MVLGLLESLKNSIQLLLDNKPLRIKYGEAGFLRAKKLFTLEKYINQFEKHYLNH